MSVPLPPREGLMPGAPGEGPLGEPRGEELIFEGRPAVIQGLGGFVLAILTLGISALGNLVLEAMDKTTPEIRVDGIKTDVMALYERLRYATEQEKRRRGVRVLDIEPA